MPFQPVILWTDALVFLLVGVTIAAVIHLRRREHLAAHRERLLEQLTRFGATADLRGPRQDRPFGVEVEDSERALSEYRDRQDAMSLDDKNNIVLSRLNALNDALLRARAAR